MTNINEFYIALDNVEHRVSDIIEIGQQINELSQKITYVCISGDIKGVNILKGYYEQIYKELNDSFCLLLSEIENVNFYTDDDHTSSYQMTFIVDIQEYVEECLKKLKNGELSPAFYDEIVTIADEYIDSEKNDWNFHA
jgi:hypothetical protein